MLGKVFDVVKAPINATTNVIENTAKTAVEVVSAPGTQTT